MVHNPLDHIHLDHDTIPDWGYQSDIVLRPSNVVPMSTLDLKDGSKISVGENIVLLFDMPETPLLESICIEYGGKFLSHNGGCLKIHNFLNKEGGIVDIAASWDKFFYMTFHGDYVNDVYACGFINLGRLLLKGDPIVPYYSVDMVSSGNSVFCNDRVVGWKIGDEVALIPKALKDQFYHPLAKEHRTEIVDIRGNLVQVASLPEFEIDYIVNLERSVILDGERGHYATMGSGSADIRYCALRNMGRNTVLGKYALHSHHVLNCEDLINGIYQFYWEGSIVDDERREVDWGASIHNSHWGYVVNNVFLSGLKGGLLIEEGSESYSIIRGNLSCPGFKSAAAYWINGTNNDYIDNIASNCGHAYYFQPNLDTSIVFHIPATNTDSSRSEQMTYRYSPLRSFIGNLAHSCERGFYFDHRLGNPPTGHKLTRCKCWNSYGNVDYGIGASIYNTDGVIFEDCEFDGCSIDNYANILTYCLRCIISDVPIGFRDYANNGKQIIEDCVFRNVEQRIRVMLSQHGGQGGPEPVPANVIKETRIINCDFGDNPGTWIFTTEKQDINTNSLVPVLTNLIYWIHEEKEYQLFWKVQEPSVIVPATSEIQDAGGAWRIGASHPGMTNVESWAYDRKCWAGSIAPMDSLIHDFDSTVEAFVCPI